MICKIATNLMNGESLKVFNGFHHTLVHFSTNTQKQINGADQNNAKNIYRPAQTKINCRILLVSLSRNDCGL